MYPNNWFGEAKDIDSGIQQQHEAVTSTPFDSTDRPMYPSNLGISYGARFKRFEEVKNIDMSIQQQGEAAGSDFLSARQCWPTITPQ